MNHFISLLAIIFLFANYSYCQEKKDEPKKNKQAPELVFEKLVHDYGTIKKGANGTCEFAFKNKGKSDLILTNVKSSCGCTVPSWPKKPIPKRKSGVIKVKYNTNRIGTINKSITVYSNATTKPILLKIKGKVTN